VEESKTNKPTIIPVRYPPCPSNIQTLNPGEICEDIAPPKWIVLDQKNDDRRVLEERIQQQQEQKVNIPVRYPPCNNFDVRKLQPGEICETSPPPKWALLEREHVRRHLVEESKQIIMPKHYSSCPSDIKDLKPGELCENIPPPQISVENENAEKKLSDYRQHVLEVSLKQQQNLVLRFPCAEVGEIVTSSRTHCDEFGMNITEEVWE
jgi:hypothetical protein